MKIVVYTPTRLRTYVPCLDVRTPSIMNRIRHNLLHLRRQSFLQHLRHFTISRGVRHLARVLVAVGVVG